MKRKIALTLTVLVLILFGVYIGVLQASPTLTPGFGASGTWGCPGGGPTTPVAPQVIVQTPQGAPTPGLGVSGSVVMMLPSGAPTPGFGITG